MARKCSHDPRGLPRRSLLKVAAAGAMAGPGHSARRTI